MPMIEQIKKYKIRALKSCILYLSFLGLGLCAGVIGPTLFDLQIITSSSLEDTSLILPSRAGGYAFGTLIGAIFLGYCDVQIVLIVCLIASSISICAFPWTKILLALCGTAAVNGLFMGCLEAAGTVWILRLWGKESGPFFQILHFCFGFGAFVGPLVAEPFLLPLPEVNANMTLPSPSEVQLKYPYGIIAIYIFLVTAGLIVIYLMHPSNELHPSREVEKTENLKKFPSKRTVILFAVILIHVYFGLEFVFGTLIAAYAVKGDLHLSKSEGSFISSVYWGNFTFFRLVSVILIIKFKPQVILAVDLLIVLFANIILLMFGQTQVWALWLGVALVGMGYSSIITAIFGYLDQFFPLTRQLASGLYVSATFGGFIFPFVVGKFIDDYPIVFVYVSMICTLVCIVSFVAMHYVAIRASNLIEHNNNVSINNARL